MRTAGNLLVIKTPPGSAHIVGVALDNANLAEVVGTICGDDTVFVACATSTEASLLSDRFVATI
jgi:transcriptional regulator of arginine metabolism